MKVFNKSLAIGSLLAFAKISFAGSIATVAASCGSTITDPSIASIECHPGLGSGSALATATSYASPGVVKVSGTTLAIEIENGGAERVSVSASSDASFSDAINFSGSPTGTTAILTYGIVVRGTTSSDLVVASNLSGLTTVAQSSEDFQLYTLLGSQLNHYSWYRNNTLQNGLVSQSESTINGVSADLFGVQYFSAPIQFGTSIPLTMRATGLASASVFNVFLDTFASAKATYELGNSIYWGGIQSVTANGFDVPWAVTSNSGTDYSRSLEPLAVPEPATNVLFLLGFFGVVLDGYRRKRIAGLTR